VNLGDHDEDLGSARPCKEAYIPEPSTKLESADFSGEDQATSDGKENVSKPPFVPKRISKKLAKDPKTKETSKNAQPKNPKRGNKLNKANNGESLPQPKKGAVPLKASKKDGQDSTSSLTSLENPMLHPPCSLPEPCHCTKCLPCLQPCCHNPAVRGGFCCTPSTLGGCLQPFSPVCSAPCCFPSMAPQTSPTDQTRIEDEEGASIQPSFAVLSALRADDLLGEGNGEEILEAFKAEELTMVESDVQDVGGNKLRTSDLFANELGENEERELWDHMENFLRENPTPEIPGIPVPWSALPGTLHFEHKPRVEKRYLMPSLLPPGCNLLHSVERKDFVEGQPWKKPHRTFVAPSGAQFHTMTGLLTHYHRLVGENNEEVYNSDALLSNPAVSSFLMSNEAAEGFVDGEVEGGRNVGLRNKLLENDVKSNTDRQGCRRVRWLPPGSTRWEESGEEKLKEALLAQEVGKEALLVQGKVREALQQLKTRDHKSVEEGDGEGRRSGEGYVGIAEEGGVKMQNGVDGGNSKQTWQESRVKEESQMNPDPRGHGVKKLPLDIELSAGLPLKELKREGDEITMEKEEKPVLENNLNSPDVETSQTNQRTTGTLARKSSLADDRKAQKQRKIPVKKKSNNQDGELRVKKISCKEKALGAPGHTIEKEATPLNTLVRESKKEAFANIEKQVKDANRMDATDRTPHKSSPHMMASKVPQGITVTQSTSNKVVKKTSVTISEKQLAAKKQSEAAKKYLEEQAKVKQASTPKGVGNGKRSPGEKSIVSPAVDAENCQAPPFKRVRRSEEARASPRKYELTSPESANSQSLWKSSEVMRLKGRPTNAKSCKMVPMGKLKFYSKEMIKVGKMFGGRRGGVDGGFIDDVVDGDRLVAKRSAKDLTYFTLRCYSKDSFAQRTQGDREGGNRVQGIEILPLPLKLEATAVEKIVDLEPEGEEEEESDSYWAISR